MEQRPAVMFRPPVDLIRDLVKETRSITQGLLQTAQEIGPDRNRPAGDSSILTPAQQSNRANVRPLG
jgi:hypothetical protein